MDDKRQKRGTRRKGLGLEVRELNVQAEDDDDGGGESLRNGKNFWTFSDLYL